MWQSFFSMAAQMDFFGAKGRNRLLVIEQHNLQVEDE
jgi:hypothetical protein